MKNIEVGIIHCDKLRAVGPMKRTCAVTSACASACPCKHGRRRHVLYAFYKYIRRGPVLGTSVLHAYQWTCRRVHARHLGSHMYSLAGLLFVLNDVTLNDRQGSIGMGVFCNDMGNAFICNTTNSITLRY